MKICYLMIIKIMEVVIVFVMSAKCEDIHINFYNDTILFCLINYCRYLMNYCIVLK